jgi:hypothetical protein
MVLVAMTAVGFGLAKPVISRWNTRYNTPAKIFADMATRGVFFAPTHILYWPITASPVLLSWTLAVGGLSLSRPRPPLHRLLRRPGTVACLAAASVLACEIAVTVLLYLLAALAGITLGFDLRSNHSYLKAYYLLIATLGFAIAAAWAMQILGRRWRAEPSWIDRGGRALGLCWIALTPVSFWMAMIN